MSKLVQLLRDNILYVAWAVALIATLGSLTFSEILHFPPCILCWYQRICMYPLVAILTIGILFRDRLVAFYALPLIVVGWVIAIYHNLLYYSVIPEAAAPCREGVSCTTQYIHWFDFVTIPLLSLAAFTIIGALMLWYWRIANESRS
jgi:disulfide bond formation protein DsbB